MRRSRLRSSAAAALLRLSLLACAVDARADSAISLDRSTALDVSTASELSTAVDLSTAARHDRSAPLRTPAGAHAQAASSGAVALAVAQSPPASPSTSSAASASAASERLAEIRVHGNYATTDADVIRLSGLVIDQTLSAAALDQAAARLRASGRFQSVEVRKRYRSLDAAGPVVVILIVQEFPTADEGEIKPPGPFGRVREKLMFLPILSFTDGYGFTYGARTSIVHALGRDGRISVPLTWGGTKRAAVEIDKGFRSGLISRIEGGAAIMRRENPLYRENDDRRQLWVHADRAIAGDGALRLGGGAGWTSVDFAALSDRFVSYGVDLTLDTRQDPSFPRNAVYARAAWETLDFQQHPTTVHRTSLEGRGYLGLFGQNVLSVRARYDRADAPLPPYEQALLGGASTLRGFRAGSFAGDNRLVTSVELRMPFTSPLSGAHTGVDLFVDSGVAYNHGARLRDVKMRQGVGAGLFVSAAIFQINADVAYGLKGDGFDAPPGTAGGFGTGPGRGGRWRFHLMSGFQF